MKVLLKNGLIMDGTGEKAYQGDVLVDGFRIKEVSNLPITADCPTIDCTGLAIAPGFIDSHSHNDSCIYFKEDIPFTEPFLRQGITTYVAGQCGFSIAGIEKGSPYGNETNFFPTSPNDPQFFNTYAEYFEYIRNNGIRQNMAMFAGHGIALGSVVGAEPKGPTTPEQMGRTAAIIEEGLDAGCKGISFGLGYRPGIFCTNKELRDIAELAVKRNKLITVHSRVMGNLGVELYGEDFSEPHNVRWNREFLDLFRGSNARVHISHLLFVGRAAWPSYDQMFEMIEKNLAMGDIDLMFDMYSYIQGGTSISVRMPPFFFDNFPQIFDDKSLWPQLEKEITRFNSGRGIEPNDVLLCNPFDDELQKYRGMFMDEICEARGMSLTELYLDLYKRSNGTASIYILIEQPEENVPKQMVHDKALYMTDAWIVPGSLQNACAYGSLPKFLRISRETKNQSMEMTVAKMTGRAATRWDLFGRGFLRKGYFADITVFNPNTVAETATPKQPEQFPIGIEHVFINGEHVLNQGNFDKGIRAGMLL
ncbi:hypothetical protein LJB83_02460 [Clostridia bacterium OttesenSCG-928-F22]|nr:hypothetical protein [Clostridia bacterium OttesenSCG-928-F22]